MRRIFPLTLSLLLVITMLTAGCGKTSKAIRSDISSIKTATVDFVADLFPVTRYWNKIRRKKAIEEVPEPLVKVEVSKKPVEKTVETNKK